MKQYVVTVNQRTYYVEVGTAGETQKPGEQDGPAPAGAAGARTPVPVAAKMPVPVAAKMPVPVAAKMPVPVATQTPVPVAAKTLFTPHRPVMAAWTHPEPSGGYRRYRPSPVQNRRNSF